MEELWSHFKHNTVQRLYKITKEKLAWDFQQFVHICDCCSSCVMTTITFGKKPSNWMKFWKWDEEFFLNFEMKGIIGESSKYFVQ